jgi:hypothetical protein
LLIGGAGADILMGSSGQNLEIGGTTAFDNNEVALAAVLAEWSSAHAYRTRLANLGGTGSGATFAGRRNGNYFLTTAGTAATVFDDGATDVLVRRAGRDWLFAGRGDLVL